MDNVLAKITAVKEKIIFGGIIIFTTYILIGIFTCAVDVHNNASLGGALITFEKFLPTVIMMGICFLCFIDNLNKISNQNKVCRLFATISLIMVPIFLILYCLGAWELIKFTDCSRESTTIYGSTLCISHGLSLFGKITTITGSLASLGTIGSITMSIKTHNRKAIEIAKILATAALTVAMAISLYLTFSDVQFLSIYLGSDKTNIIFFFTLCFCLIAWIILTVFAFYLSKFDNGVAPTPIKPLNAKVVSASAPAVLTIEEVKDEKPETIYPEPTNTPIHHVDGVNLNASAPEEKPEKTPAPKPEEHHDDAPLHASPGEPLFEEHPTIGPATSGTSHDVFDSLDSQENENKEVL